MPIGITSTVEKAQRKCPMMLRTLVRATERNTVAFHYQK